ncbi:protein phosphatase 2C domain-containing protein [Leifsonia sp. H3M29-4]|uniref:PP2C family protein-serine/threonine phosphatase n=1 Tax=Salinibacterium metalliresistens TaxID=3031321 RepID=UPI0023DBF0AB|nr:protein phosphatase 2C domain-containing protein [Salinibacterium metalliresistens]MDF1479342.1 protein phosphatase 2C domain-containing protein [Salinibacterium metalliresistens]
MSVEVRQQFDLPGATARFRFSGHSDRGSVRKLNEDSYLTAAPYFAVADGMGGHAHGDRASQAAIAAFADLPGGSPARAQDVLDTIARANEAVLGLTEGTGDGALSGTTLTGIALVNVVGDETCHWMAFNIGDSRTYSWDGRTLAQLSVDHSAVQELVDLGRLTRQEAERHPYRNVVTRALGADDEVEADIWLIPARARQTFLLCSDGLTKELADDEIARIIVFHDAEAQRESDGLPLTLAERLVRAAVAAGGSDNVTVVVVEFELVGDDTNIDDTLERGSLPGVLEDTRPRS